MFGGRSPSAAVQESLERAAVPAGEEHLARDERRKLRLRRGQTGRRKEKGERGRAGNIPGHEKDLRELFTGDQSPET
jgi:hypothetical protein